MPRRILIAKPGLDGHDRGAKVIARALRDAGCEVIYSGLHRTPGQIVAMALEEDVDAIGLSTLSGAHLTLFPLVMDELRYADAEDIVVFGGGVIPAADVDVLLEAGLAKIFTPGSALADIAEWVMTNVSQR
ncbi:MAG: cobalamin B12-binding domain-containing protein [Acidimicrobiia bacterium]|nr:cobalamin B12-binding domain-containing protein [Acidimicrobiia bacterium]MDH5502430.1 cobalamin B12-binding domain-containing protein [Acidimicrobiia bacterium]